MVSMLAGRLHDSVSSARACAAMCWGRDTTQVPMASGALLALVMKVAVILRAGGFNAEADHMSALVEPHAQVCKNSQCSGMRVCACLCVCA